MNLQIDSKSPDSPNLQILYQLASELLQRRADFGVGLQLVLHLELTEAGCQRAGEHALDVAVDGSGQRDAPAIVDDVNRRVGHRGLIPERRVAVDSARDAIAQLVVKG